MLNIKHMNQAKYKTFASILTMHLVYENGQMEHIIFKRIFRLCLFVLFKER